MIREVLVPFNALDIISFHGIRDVGKHETYFNNVDHDEVIQVLTLRDKLKDNK